MKLNKNKNWIYAKNIIPGGNMLISKRSDFLLPDYWPSYYKKAKGCFVWDLNNNKLLDMYFGVGTNIHGYTNNKIDKQVHEVIKNSNMSSLNSYDEVLLAKELIKIHKWPSMAKFSRSGGEANAIAITTPKKTMKHPKILMKDDISFKKIILIITVNGAAKENNILFLLGPIFCNAIKRRVSPINIPIKPEIIIIVK